MLVPLVTVPPVVLLGGLVLLASALAALLRVLVLRRRLAGTSTPGLDELTGPATTSEPASPASPAPHDVAVAAVQEPEQTLPTDPPPLRVHTPVEIRVDPRIDLPHQGPAPTAYADLARQLAEIGDLEAAVVTQWVADLQVLAPRLRGQGQVLADLVGATAAGCPVSTLRESRAAALSLIPAGSSVQALLTPLDHLSDLLPASQRPRGRHAAAVPTHPQGLPIELRELLPAHQLAAYDALVGDGQERSA